MHEQVYASLENYSSTYCTIVDLTIAMILRLVVPERENGEGSDCGIGNQTGAEYKGEQHLRSPLYSLRQLGYEVLKQVFNSSNKAT